MITRRACLFAGGSALLAPAFARASDPWKKDASEWSDKDIRQIVTKSPWAKEVAVEFKGGGPGAGGWSGGGGGRGRGGRGGGGGGAPMGDASAGGGGWGGGGGGGGMGPGGGGGGGFGGAGGGGGWNGGNPRSMDSEGRGGMPQMKTTVRWESAKAVRDARKKPTRPEDAPFYIVSVGPLPAGPPGGQGSWGGAESAPASEADRRKWLENRLKETTRLERKGQDPIVPDRAVVVEGNGARMLVFYFPRNPHPIEPADKEVVFATALGPMEIKARFPLKDMSYGSQLEL